MSKFMLRRDVNKERSFCSIVNFLTACQIKSIEDCLPMFRAFHSRGEDVVVDIPDELDSRFREALAAVDFQYEEI